MNFILHKGTGMTTEFRNLPFTIKLAETAEKTFDAALKDTPHQIQKESCVLLNQNPAFTAQRIKQKFRWVNSEK